MPSVADRQKTNLIRKAAAESRKRLGKNAKNQFQRFLSAYYANVPPQDIRDNPSETVFGLAHGHWKHGQTRKRGRTLVRVFNPDPKKVGWET